MSARSLQQQDDVFYLLASKSDLATVSIFAEAKGVKDSDVDAALAPRRVRNGKKAGLALIVAQPSEMPENKDNSPILINRIHVVRVIEVPEVNRKSGGSQITADLAKDLVMQRLHYRYLGKACLMWIGNEPWVDAKNGYGWEVRFVIVDDLPSEARAAQPIIQIVDGMCTILGANAEGEVIYYTVNGVAPVPAISGVQTYNGPFPVSGVTVRASTIATGKLLSAFSEETAEESAGAGDADTLTTEGGDTIITESGDPLVTET
jgi:hypothetical protein